MIVREMSEKDYEAFKGLFDEAYLEYLESLKLADPQKYEKEKREKREATRGRFNFYVKTGSSFVAEEKGGVIGYVASQTVPYSHGVDRLLWIEYVVVKSEHRRKGIGTALLKRLADYAERNSVDRIYATINPDNEASIKLHEKIGFNVRSWRIASFKPAN